MELRYNFTPEIVNCLMQIEAARQTVRLTILPPRIAAALRRQARVRSTHFSTRIEGNRLTLAQAAQVLVGGKAAAAPERDVPEVQNYYRAMDQVEKWAQERASVTEDLLRRLHALLYSGPRARPTPYRDGQNLIRNTSTGEVVYMPPEAADVPRLMAELVEWLGLQATGELPAPVVAGLAHYQLVAIYPFYDGNGRTARALDTWILYRRDYDLGKFYSLEEAHVGDLDAYYAALRTVPHHNYYDGRATADLTGWLGYFLRSMASEFTRVAGEVKSQADAAAPVPVELWDMDRRARLVLGLFTGQKTITSKDVAQLLGLSQRTVRDLLNGWTADGWLEVSDSSRKARCYQLTAKYRQVIGGITAE